MAQTENSGYNPTALIISNKVFSDGLYCSFRASYGKVIATLDEDEASEHIDEGLYFMGLSKLGIIVKGRLLKDGFVEDKKGSWFPPADIADKLYDEADGYEGIYRRKAGTFGFNCDNEKALNINALAPVAELLRRVNDELTALEEDITTAKAVLKEAGLPVSMVDKNSKKKAIIARLLG